MKTRDMLKLVPLSAVILTLAGCMVALDAIVPESDAIFDPRLVGTWADESSSDLAVIMRVSNLTYAIEYKSKGTVSSFQARLGSLGGRMVVDVWATPGDGEVPELYADIMIMAHTLFALEIGSNEVNAAALELDSLLDHLREEEPLLSYQQLEEQLILHGTTDQLRAALGAHLASPNVLAEPTVWRRVEE